MLTNKAKLRCLRPCFKKTFHQDMFQLMCEKKSQVSHFFFRSEGSQDSTMSHCHTLTLIVKILCSIVNLSNRESLFHEIMVKYNFFSKHGECEI